MALEPQALKWQEFLAGWRWHQGEHVSLVGPTGSGKTVLAQAILDRRGHVLYLASKPKDSNLDRLRRPPFGFQLERNWPVSQKGWRSGKVLLWPPMQEMKDIIREAETVGDMLEGVYREGGWCIVIDELAKVTNDLGHRTRLRLLWQQGRSLGISIVGLTQRPAWVPLELYSQARHIFLWNTNDERDLKTIQAIGGMSLNEVRRIVGRLPQHHVLYLDTRTREMVTTVVDY